MAFLLAGAFWFALALLVGLISGTPFLRTFGAAGVVVFFLAALLLDHFSSPSYDAHEDAERDWQWPSRKDEAA